MNRIVPGHRAVDIWLIHRIRRWFILEGKYYAWPRAMSQIDQNFGWQLYRRHDGSAI